MRQRIGPKEPGVKGPRAGPVRGRRGPAGALRSFLVFDPGLEPPAAGHPLYGLDNAILSPHVSGFVPSYDDGCSDLFAENLRRYLGGAPLLNRVDRARGY
jgi:hypothetical protein